MSGSEAVAAAPRRAAVILLLFLLPATVLTVQFFSNVQAGLTEADFAALMRVCRQLETNITQSFAGD